MLNRMLGFVFSFTACTAFADQDFRPFARGFGGTLGASYEVGRLGDSGMGLADRTLTAESGEALFGYRFGPEWLLGLDFDYRVQQQQTRLQDAGQTNLKGQGYLLALGAQYRFAERWAVQAALDLFGRYDFHKQTAASQDDHLHGPIGLRLKAQYFLARSFSIDASGEFDRWSTFHVENVDHDQAATQWMVGLGLTYHFGFGDGSSSAEATPAEPAPVPMTPAPVEPAPMETAATVPPESAPEATASSSDDATSPTPEFASGSTQIDGAARDRLAAFAKTLPRDARVTVEGYADQTGPERENIVLSRKRAANVRAILVKHGLRAKSVRAEGFGSSRPVADNETEAGRAQNRRVEIHVE